MKINNQTGITYSMIGQNTNDRRQTQQSVSADLENKMTQYTDTLSISKTGQENFKHLSSVSSMDCIDRFEKEVANIFENDDKTDSVKSDTFENHVNRMAAAYDKMKNSIEEKYAAEDYEPEYYVADNGRIEELTKEKELDMLDKAYKSHSELMATSTEIWSKLQDFKPTTVRYKSNGQSSREQSIDDNKEKNTAKSSKENGVVKKMAYQAFLSAVNLDNQKLSQQYSGDWREFRSNLDISDNDRKTLNSIWDYYANKKA